MKGQRAERPEAALSEKELKGYRRWAAQLQEESREPGGSCSCDPEVWEFFDPAFSTGKQIYESFTDEELLDVMIATMNRPGHTPQFQEIHELYRRYLSRRFGDLARAKRAARIRYKQLRDESRWPWDWPDRVSPEPVLDRCRKRGISLSDKETALLEQLCRAARYTRMPPVLSSEEARCLQRLGGARRTVELMGIPQLERSALRHMRSYWQQQAARANALENKEIRHTEESCK